MLVELCAKNYAIHDGLVNGADGIFQVLTNVLNSQEVICILFNHPKCDELTRMKIAHLYEHEIHLAQTLVELVSKDIQIVSNFFHIMIKTNFPFNWLQHVLYIEHKD
jgi:hypothetical protein